MSKKNTLLNCIITILQNSKVSLSIKDITTQYMQKFPLRTKLFHNKKSSTKKIRTKERQIRDEVTSVLNRNNNPSILRFDTTNSNLHYQWNESLDNTIENNTETFTVCKQRVGQDIFRENLMLKYNNQCAVSDVNEAALLRASHIIPWKICNDELRLDSNNGLLLSSKLDDLFDKGFISFDSYGTIMISKKLSQCIIKDYNISHTLKIKKYDSNIERNMLYHRNHIFNT